jgi:hypothetical protein
MSLSPGDGSTAASMTVTSVIGCSPGGQQLISVGDALAFTGDFAFTPPDAFAIP